MVSNGGDGELTYRTLNRRKLLAAGVAVGVGGLAGCGGSGGDPSGGNDGSGGQTDTTNDGQPGDGGGVEETGSTPADESEGGCTPGYSEGDLACQQVADAVGSLTPFPVAGTDSVVAFDHPCGWQPSTTDQFEDRFQANSTRDGFGADGNAYVDVQIRVYYQSVSEGFIDEERTSGNYEDASYDYAGQQRTAIVSNASSASFGTVAHAAVPDDGSLAHVEFVSTLKGASCDIEPRPDYDVVVSMVESLGGNAETTFTFA